MLQISQNSQENKCDRACLRPATTLKKRLCLTQAYSCEFREICKNACGRLYLSVFSPNAGKYGPEKLQIQRLFTQSTCTSAIELSLDSNSHTNSSLDAYLNTDGNLFVTLRHFSFGTSSAVLKLYFCSINTIKIQLTLDNPNPDGRQQDY